MAIIGRGQLTLTDMNDVLASPTPPVNPTEGALWWNTTEAQLYVYSGGQWMPSKEVLVGGRNYFKKSEDLSSWTASASGATIIDYSGNERQAKLTDSAYIQQSTTVIGFDFSDTTKTWTISVWAKGTTTGQSIGITLSGSHIGWSKKTLTTEWAKYIWTFKGVGISLQSFRFESAGQTATYPIYWRKPKLEEGNVPTDWEPAIEDIGDTITEIEETLGNMANDNLLDYNERKVIKDKLTDIIGYVIADSTTTMPTTATLDTGLKGNFYMYRKRALNAGLLSTDAKYVAVATKYNDLKTYLEGLTPIDAWDLRTTNQYTNISVTKSTFRDKWLQYYLAIEDLAEATTQKLKDNVDNVVVGGTNYASNGDFVQALTDGLWKDYYVGQTKEIIDISTEKPPFRYAYHVNNTSNANGGIFSPSLFSGSSAEGLVDKEITVSFWLKYTGIVVGTNSWNTGRFGEIIITGQKADLSYVYSYPQTLDVTGTNSVWTKYSKTIKLSLPSGATKITNIQLKHGLEGCVGEFWTTGIKVESGNKVTDWSPNPEDMQGQINNVVFKLTPDSIMSSVSSTSTYQALESEVSGKAKTFVATPTIPYYIGDVWKNGSTVYICTVNRTSGSYTSADWTKVGDVTGSNTSADTSKVAGTTASTVRDNASNAMTAINDMTSDDKLTPVEKQQLKKEWATISAEKATYEALATTYGITTEKTNFVNAYNTLNTTLNNTTNGYLLSLTTTTTLATGGGATFRAQFDDYYDKKALLFKKINETARTLANNANDKIDNLQIGGSNILDKTGYYGDTHSFSSNVGTSVTTSIAFIDEVLSPTGRAVTLTRTDTVTASGGRYWVVPNGINATPTGEVFSWSFWAKGVGSWTIGSERGGTKVIALTDTWTKYEHTFTANSSATYQFVVYRTSGTTGGTITFHSLKFEKSGKPTGWTPSQSDIDGLITKAQSDADKANNAISDMSSDSKITPVEKVQLKKEWATISAEKATYEALATTYGITTEKTNFVNAYNTLNTTLNGTSGILLNMTTTSSVTGSTFRGQFDDYYDKKALLIKKVNETSRTLANTAQDTADSKSKTFTATPTIPYTIGDVWKNSSTVYICTVTRTSGSYTSSDWTKVGDVTSANTSADTSKVNGIGASTVTGVLANANANIINANPIFLDWTSTNPVGYSTTAVTGLTKVTSGNGMGNAVKYTVGAGGNHYLSPNQVTTQPYFQYITVESTFMLESGTIDGAGILMRYNATANVDHKIHFKDLVASPTVGKWYTVSKTIKQPTSPSGFTGYSVYPMGGWTSFGTVTVKVIQFDSIISRPATEQEINSYENDIMIKDMSADGKVTPMEKVQLKKEWATISAEKPTYETLATTYGITTEKTNFVNAYNTLNTALNGTSGILVSMTTTSTVTATTFRGQFDDYYDKKALLTKKINEIARTLANDAQSDIDNLDIGGRNLLRNSDFSHANHINDWTTYNGNSVDSSIIQATFVDERTKPFLRIASVTGLGLNASYGSYSLNGFNTKQGKEYTLSFLVGCHANGDMSLDYTYLLYPNFNNQRIVIPNITTFEQVGQFNGNFNLTIYRVSVTFVASQTDVNVNLLLGTTTANDYTATSNYSVFYVSDIKLEQGNRLTDWTPAPEDLANVEALNDALSTVTEEYNSAIIETSKDITQTLESKITTESGKITEAYQSEIKSTAENIQLSFTEFDGRLNTNEGEMTEVRTYFNFSPDGLGIGKSDSPLNINVSNDQIDFIDNGTVVAYVNGQMMYIDSLQVLSSLIVGNHKIEKYNENITLIKYSG